MVEKENLPCWTNQDQQTDSEDHLSAVVRWLLSTTELRCFISHRTRVVHFSYLMPPRQQQSRRGQCDSSKHRAPIFRGSASPTNSLQIHPPLLPQMGSSTHLRPQQSPSIRRFLCTILRKKWCIYEGHCGLSYDIQTVCRGFTSSDVEDRVRSGARGSEIVAAFFSYLFHLLGTKNCTEIWRAVRLFFTSIQRLLSLLKTEISCAKDQGGSAHAASECFLWNVTWCFEPQFGAAHADETLERVWTSCHQSQVCCCTERRRRLKTENNTVLCCSFGPQRRCNCTT